MKKLLLLFGLLFLQCWPALILKNLPYITELGDYIQKVFGFLTNQAVINR